MDNLAIRTEQIPDTLPELSKFVLVGREKLAAVRAEIRAIDKVGLAKEVLEQKKAEAQEIAELVTLSEVRIGGMLKEIPKATTNHKNLEIAPKDNFLHTKAETVKELGFTPKQTAQFQRMADHESIVLEAIADARENDDIISRAAVLKKIDESRKPHVANNSGNNEWYTPSGIIEAARQAMGSIDLDPASNVIAQQTVKASEYFTIETNGLKHEWFGNVFMNPPYSADIIGRFISKLAEQLGNIEQAVVLVNNATETEWFNDLISMASAVCFPKGRVKYYAPEGEARTPLQGQAIVYVGINYNSFLEAFQGIGWGCLVV